MISDNSKTNDHPQAPLTRILREKAVTWTLGDDVSLLQHMQKLSSGIIGEVASLNSELKTVHKDAISALARVDQVSQAFNLLSSSQYVESRVYEDDDEETSSRVSTAVSHPSATREEKEEAMIPKLREAFEIGMSILQPPAFVNGNEHGFDPVWDFNSRPLPYLVGSDDFFRHPVAGLRICYENNNTVKGRIAEKEEKEIKVDRDEEKLSTSTSTSVSPDSEDDTPSRPQGDVPGVHVQVPNVPQPGFEQNITSVLPGRISPSFEEESDNFKENLVSDTKDSSGSKETKPKSTSGLFGDDSNSESDEDLFHPKVIANKGVLLPNGKVLQGVSVFGPQPPKIPAEPTISQSKPIISKDNIPERVNAPQISKPKSTSLFDDDEEDLFASFPARSQVPAPKTPTSSRPGPKLKESTSDTSKSVVIDQSLRNPEPRKQKSLFEDSDSEDDLFTPVKSSSTQANFPKVSATSQVPAVAPRIQAPKVAESRTKILCEDEDDDLFAPIISPGLVSQDNSKLTTTSGVPRVQTQNVAESNDKKNILYEDDYLFAPVTASGIASSNNPKLPPNSEASEAKKVAETDSKAKILYEDDLDDLFSTKPTMPKPDKLRVKDALSTAVIPAAVQPIFEAQISATASKKSRSRSASPRGTEPSSFLPTNSSSDLTVSPSKKPVSKNSLFDFSDSDDDLFARVSTSKSALSHKVIPVPAPETNEQQSTLQIHSAVTLEQQKKESDAQKTFPTAIVTNAPHNNLAGAPDKSENGRPKAAKIPNSLFQSDDEDDLFAGNRSEVTKSKSVVRAERSTVITTVSPPTPPQVPPPDKTEVPQISPNISVSPKSPTSVHSTFNASVSSDQKDLDSSQNTTRGDSQYSGPSSGRGSSVSPSFFVSPLVQGGNSDSELGRNEKSAKKPVGGVALFGGALFLGGKTRPSSRESPSSTPSAFSGELPPVFTPSPVASSPSFEGPTSISGPSPDVLPTLLKARAKIAAKRKPPSKRFRQQGLPSESISGDSLAPVDNPVPVEAAPSAKLPASTSDKLPKSILLPEDKSPIRSDPASQTFESEEQESSVVLEKPATPMEVDAAVEQHDNDFVQDPLSESFPETARLESSLNRKEKLASTGSSKESAPSKLAALFDSDDEEDLFASTPARTTASTKPVSPKVGAALASNSDLNQSSLANSRFGAFVDEESDDDLFATGAGDKGLPQKTPLESESASQPWKDVQEKPSKPRVSAALFNDEDSDEDLFSTKSSAKFPPVPRNTTAFSVPKRQPAPFKDPLLGSP